MVEVQDLKKVYGNHVALQGLNFTIPGNGVYGFLGPNGAGKSTTMNILAGCLAPTQGQVRVAGFDIRCQGRQARGAVGYLPEQPPLYPDMTPWEYLQFVARALGIPAGDREAQVRSAMEATQITQVANRLCRQLSKGYRQRVGIAQTLLGDRRLIILDEPMSGLDPGQSLQLRNLIGELGQTHTVLLSSHILPQLSTLCDHLLILHRGRLIADDTPQALEARYAGQQRLRLKTRATREELRKVLAGQTWVRSYQITGEEGPLLTAQLQAEPGTEEEAFFAFARAGMPLLELIRLQPGLEDIFLALTREAQGEGDLP